MFQDNSKYIAWIFVMEKIEERNPKKINKATPYSSE